MSIFILGFAIIWELMAISVGGFDFFALIGVPLLLFGLYALVGRLVLDILLRRSTRYELTNRRVIIARDGWFPKLTSVQLPDLPHMTLTERRSGKGTIRFAEDDLSRINFFPGLYGWTPSLDPAPQLINIERASDVYLMMQREAAAFWEDRQ